MSREMKNKIITAAAVQLLLVSLFLASSFLLAADLNTDRLINMEILKARAYHEEGKLDDAIRCMKEAKLIDTTSARPYIALAELYKEMKKYDEVISEYAEAAKLEPNSAELAKLLGDAYITKAESIEKGERQGDAAKERKEAANSFERIFALTFTKDDRGNKRDSFKSLVKDYKALGEYKNALAATDKWKKVVPDDPEASIAAGEIQLSMKEYGKARISFREAEQSMQASEGIKQIARDDLKIVDKELGSRTMEYVKWGGIGGAVLILILIGVFFIIKSRSGDKPELEVSKERERDDSLEDLNTVEGICEMAIRKLMHLTQMPRGIIYLPTEEESLLIPKVAYGLQKEAENLEYSALDTRDWIVEKEGGPFVFKLERREVAFCRAFPDTGNTLGELHMRVGVPLVLQSKFFGIGYFGCPETKDKTKFRKLYEQNRPIIVKVATEIAELLNDLLSRKQAITDTFTGLYNEIYFNEKFPQMIDEARLKSKTCSLMLVAIDGYKDLMETFGEDYGEKLIKLSAIALSSAIADTDSILCRLRETTFAIVYPEATQDAATELTEKVREEISSVKIARHIPPATASIAVGTFPATAIYAEKLLELVQDALEKAQSEGGNRVQIAEKKLRTMETTKMTRDQVLAAVERRRQVRKAMKTVPEESPDEPVEERDLPQREERMREAPAAASGEKPSSQITPWLAPQPSPRSQPAAPIPMDVREKRQGPYPSSDDIPQQPSRGGYSSGEIQQRSPGASGRDYNPSPQPGARANPAADQKRPLPISTKGESGEIPKSASPFSRRTPYSSSTQEGGEPSEGGAFEAAPAMMDQMGGAADSPPQGARTKSGGPAGPLDFSREMKTIEQREMQAQMRPGRDERARPHPLSPQQGSQSPARDPAQAARQPAGKERSPGGSGERSAILQGRTPSAPTPAQPRPLSQESPQAQANVTSDPLTGFYHRSYFEKVLLSEAQKLRQNPGECTLLYFGLDNFENLKNACGSPNVRKVIKDITEKLRFYVEEGRGIPGRIEENGFALFLPYTSLQVGNDLAAKMRQAVTSLQFQEVGQTVTISLGVASYPNTVRNFREIVVNSRKAMEKAMKSGGNKVEVGYAS